MGCLIYSAREESVLIHQNTLSLLRYWLCERPPGEEMEPNAQNPGGI